MNIETERRGSILCTRSSTDAYQSNAKIMSHEYANKYANYWSKKNKVIKTGKANFKDVVGQKTYNAEFCAIAEWKHKLKSIQTAQSSND